MSPIPCAHCGYNFMRQSTDLEAPKLCNSCQVRELIINPKSRNQMENVKILIECSQEEQREIEEICIRDGKDFSRYFLELHYGSLEAERIFQANKSEAKESEFIETNARETEKKIHAQNRGKKR